MTKTIRNIIAALALTTTPIAAMTQDQQAMCKSLGALAHQVMVNRQAGIALSDMLEALPKGQENADVGKAIIHIVMTAYETPRYSTRTYQIVAAEDYRNDIETACFRRAMQ